MGNTGESGHPNCLKISVVWAPPRQSGRDLFLCLLNSDFHLTATYITRRKGIWRFVSVVSSSLFQFLFVSVLCLSLFMLLKCQVCARYRNAVPQFEHAYKKKKKNINSQEKDTPIHYLLRLMPGS